MLSCRRWGALLRVAVVCAAGTLAYCVAAQAAVPAAGGSSLANPAPANPSATNSAISLPNFSVMAAPGAAKPASTDIPALGATPDAQHVVVVANSREPESEPIARYYMKQRGIPDKNLILIDAPTTTDITWTEFVEQVFNPLRTRLAKDGWLSAYVTDQKDSEGRLKFVFYGNKIDFLVVCYGVPVRIASDPARLVPTPLTVEHKELNTNQAAVDAELSLLAAVNTPTNGLVNNPLYNKLTPDEFTRGLVVKVARLDGPTPAAVRGMIDSAIAGEAHGLQGRAYLDFAGYGETDSRYEGELWLKNASATVHQLGFDISEDHESSLFSWRTRFDAPAIYLGWYAEHPYGPISATDFKFPPGAIAIHIHSFSAENIRNAGIRWVGPLIMRGVAATVGNVFEPYLHFTHHLDLFMDALARGKTTG
ncbi:MAG TPA: TIGR03790 family protein, partial [Opitutales bacterium]|nr:TIGR03790 family protein [Opitutales bacterium]